MHLVVAVCALLTLSSCSVIKETVDGAKEGFREAEALRISNSTVAQINSGHYTLALPMLEKAILLAPNNPYIQKNLGITLVAAGDPKRAINFLQKALVSLPTDSSLIQEISLAYVRMGMFEKARQELELYSAKSGDHSAAIIAHIRALREQERRFLHLRNLPGANSKDDYFVFATALNGLTRWSNRKTPLHVFIEPDKAAKAGEVHGEMVFKKALSDWEKASDGKLHFKMVPNKKHAEITVRFIRNPAELKDPIKAGETVYQANILGIEKADVKVLVVDRRTGAPETEFDIYATSLHEIGHALGISDHSPNPDDIMFYTLHQLSEMPELSSRDKKTLKLIYASKKAYIPAKGSPQELQTNKYIDYNAKIAILNSSINACNARQFKKAIEKANSYLKLVPIDDPNADTAKQLLEIAYSAQAESLINSGNLTGAEELLKKALSIHYKKAHTNLRATTQRKFDDLAKRKQ